MRGQYYVSVTPPPPPPTHNHHHPPISTGLNSHCIQLCYFHFSCIKHNETKFLWWIGFCTGSHRIFTSLCGARIIFTGVCLFLTSILWVPRKICYSLGPAEIWLLYTGVFNFSVFCTRLVSTRSLKQGVFV